MIKKLLIIIVLVMVASLSIAGCTSSTSNNHATSSASRTTSSAATTNATTANTTTSASAMLAPVHIGLTQGIANDGTYNYGISNTAIYKYDADWKEIAVNTNAGAQVGVNHLGDGCVDNGVLYIAACDWASCGNWSNSRIGEWNTSDLSFKGYVDISAQHFDAAGCGVDTADGYMWVCSYCNGNGAYYIYHLPDFSYVGSIAPSPAFTYVQGIKYYGGYLFVSVLHTGIVRMNLNGTGQTTIIPFSKLNAGELEGLDVKSDYIRVLCGRYVFTFVNNY